MEAFFSQPIVWLPACTVTVDGTLFVVTREPNDGEDHISALPDDLRRNIVSPLPIKDIVHTTALSTRWHHVWHSTLLVLYDLHLDPDEPARVAAADRILAGHPGLFHTVHLALCFFDKHEHELDQWWWLLAAGGIQNLALIGLPREMDLLCLPVDIVRCAKPERLYLGCWHFSDTADLPDGTGVFPHLRELTMVNTFFEDRDLDHMLASSPVLKTLVPFFSFDKPKHVCLHGQRLQCVLFWESMAFDLEVVDSPLLKHLIMWDTCPPGPIGDVSLMGLGFLKADTKVSPRTMLPSVKILALKVNLGVFKEVQMLFSFIRCFPNIETLHVESARVDEPTGKHYAEFFRELSPIECV
ncbi:F-box/LRR-repeat protein At3g26922-like [Miscanthus floridulus]|uniref:F-box/LRR-repeat protein At3g26922-like n=1 Tax=Miscanthus floridulus TaxID=154761 RepID=UPI00345AAEC6